VTAFQRLRDAWATSGSLLCIGLDPDPRRIPDSLGDAEDPVFEFCRRIVDATADLVCAYKPQFAHFAAQRAEPSLERLCTYIHERHPGVFVLLDAKRGDIGSTAEHYAAEAFDRYGADAVTVNPYLGFDAIEPFLGHAGRAIFVLCRTSNPGSGDFQDLLVDGRPLYQHVAGRVAEEWSGAGECGLVVGATWPGELAEVRAIVGDLPILVPGIGAQGGDIEATLAAGVDSSGAGLLLSSSRAILHASAGADFAEAARAAAGRTLAQIRAATAVT
jgi:orotidine-5'-phosphate decarboxylase